MSNKSPINSITRFIFCTLIIFVLLTENFILCTLLTSTEEIENKIKHDQPKNKQGFFQSFFSGYCLIFISELLDRTFFLNMIYALTHSFMKTFIISTVTLLSLNTAALILGNSMPIFFYKNIIDWIAVIVFFFIGSILLYDSLTVDGHVIYEDYKEVETLVRKQSQDAKEQKINEKGQLGQLKEPLIERNKEEPAFDTTWSFVTSLILAECGDKSQITGVVIGAVYNFYSVWLGTTLGYLTCILLAIWSGHFLSQKITKRQIHLVSGVTFIVFGITYLLQLLNLI
jgi:putative Ca2+/H+ antiporter (TMEM165/GDT1 family)